MSGVPRPSHITKSGDVRIESYVDGEGPGFVLLPSYGRDGGDDFDDITARLVGDSWRVHPATLRTQREAVAASDPKASSAGGNAPILPVIAEKDPFNPKPSWNELTKRLGERVTQLVVANAFHALFPEQPDAVAAGVLPWAARLP